MKKINLKGISEILSEKDLKNVIGGAVFQKADKGGGSNGTGGIGECYSMRPCDNDSDWAACAGKLCKEECYNSNSGRKGHCAWILAGFNACKTCSVGAL
jgi:natural product precursor